MGERWQEHVSRVKGTACLSVEAGIVYVFVMKNSKLVFNGSANCISRLRLSLCLFDSCLTR